MEPRASLVSLCLLFCGVTPQTLNHHHQDEFTGFLKHLLRGALEHGLTRLLKEAEGHRDMMGRWEFIKLHCFCVCGWLFFFFFKHNHKELPQLTGEYNRTFFLEGPFQTRDNTTLIVFLRRQGRLLFLRNSLVFLALILPWLGRVIVLPWYGSFIMVQNYVVRHLLFFQKHLSSKYRAE